MRVVFVLAFLIAIVVTTCVMAAVDEGFHRFNRVKRSDLLQRVPTFSITSLHSDHFLSNSASTPFDTMAMTSATPWSALWEQLRDEMSSTPTLNTLSLPAFKGSLSPTQRHVLGVYNRKIANIATWAEKNAELTSTPQTLSTFYPTAPLHTPQYKIKHNIPEPLHFEHPQQSSVLVNIQGDLLTLNLTRFDGFPMDFRPPIHEHDSNGVRVKTTTNNNVQTNCYYTAIITNVAKHTSTAKALNLIETSSTTSNYSSLSIKNKPENTTQVHFYSTTTESNLKTLGEEASAFLTPFAVDMCRGGLNGIIPYNGTFYQVLPLPNHLAFDETIHLMSQLSNDEVDVTDLHIVYDVNQPHFDYRTHPQKMQQRLVEAGTGPAALSRSTEHDTSFCGHHHNNDDHSHDQLESHAENNILNSHPYYQIPLKTPEISKFDTLQVTLQKYLEWVIVMDSALTNTYGVDPATANTLKVHQTMQTFTSYHNDQSNPARDSRFTGFQLNIALTNIITWTGSDPYDVQPGCPKCSSGEVSVDTLLTAFKAWGQSLIADKNIDNIALFSGRDFESGVLGYASLGSTCTANAFSINQMTSTNQDFNALIAMHEVIGHNFDADHDAEKPSTSSCPTSTNIMSASLSSQRTTGEATRFSHCSVSAISAYILRASCLDNTPAYIYGNARCGDGIVSANEQCECSVGSTASIESCCVCSTCNLASSVVVNGETITPQCASNQSCCTSTCQIESSGTVCRASLGNTCDIIEKCDGTSPICPADARKGTGHSCIDINNAAGQCFEGNCFSEFVSCRFHGFSPCAEANLHYSPSDPNFCSNKQCYVGGRCAILALSGSDTPMPYDNGVPCGGPGKEGWTCYESQCVPPTTSAISGSFNWDYGQWEDCVECGEPQLRSATCVDINTRVTQTTGLVCPEPTYTKTELVRPCNSVKLGCVYDYSQKEKDQHKNQIYFFGVWVSTAIVAVVCVGVIIIWIVLGLCCYLITSRPVDGIKDMSEDLNPDDKKSKKDKKKKRRDSGGILIDTSGGTVDGPAADILPPQSH